jgi:hypothetical protein
MVLMEESQSKTYDSVLYSKRLHRELDAHIKLAIILACFCLKGAMSFLHLFHFADADATLVGEILGVQKQVTH